MEKLSVIVPVYNVYPYLRECLDSIINQTYKNLEIIVVNDASPYSEDDEICKEYALKDNRIIYIKHEENKGSGGARNTGINTATGKYITFVDSDDFLGDIRAYEECMEVLKKYEDINLVFYWYGYYKHNEITNVRMLDTIEFHKKIKLDSKKRFEVPAVWIKIFKLDDIINNELYFLDKVKFEDLDFWFRYQMLVKPVVYGINKMFYLYRQQDGSITHNMHKHIADYYPIFSNMIDVYHKNNEPEYRELLLYYYSHLKYMMPYFQNLGEKEYEDIVNKITLLIKSIEMTEDEFIKYLGVEFYQYLFNNKYIFTLFQNTKKQANKKRLKYLFIKENIILYKLKRETKRIIRKIKGKI